MTVQPDKKIAVIGGGLGGLAAACTLAARGHRVALFDKNSWPGGKAAVLAEDGFSFDMGPTILTLPSVLRRIFSESGRNIEDYLELVRLDPQWRCFFQDGSVLDLLEDTDSMVRELHRFSDEDGIETGYRRFMTLSEKLHDISNRFFFYKPIGGIKDMFSLRESFNVALLRDVLALRMGKSVGDTIREFIPDARVSQMMDHFTQYVGSCPENSPAVLCGIADMQTREGIWYPMGGIGAVPKALVKLAGELGVEFHLNTEVARIHFDGDAVTGLTTTAGDTHRFDVMVSNSDAVRTYTELADSADVQRSFNAGKKYDPACSGVVLYLGLNRRYEHLEHHNFVFSRNPEEEFHAIYEEGEPAPDPTCYLAAPSRTDPAVAPEGGEALYVLVHTPYLRSHHDWNRMLPKYRKVILDKLKTTGKMEDIEDRIVFESALTPQSIHDRYRVLNGAIYGLASHGNYFGAFKPSNRSPYARGLYLSGGASHPGPGMPMVLMSGWIAGDSADEDIKSGAVSL
jgi:phytoene desaturase